MRALLSSERSRWLSRHLLVAAGLLLSVALLTRPEIETAAATVTEPKPLEDFPLQAGAWHGTSDRFTRAGVTALDVDDWMLRRYGHSDGSWVWLYMGFLSKIQAQRAHHAPHRCYPGQGWTIQQSGVQTIDLVDGKPIKVNTMTVQKGLERRFVLYWEQQGDNVLIKTQQLNGVAALFHTLNYYSTVLQAMWNRQSLRQDRTFVRVSAPIELDMAVTQAREIDFIRAIFPQVVKHTAS